jgi:prepilin-type N-terminal cleavage/methylation domain-containing protein
MKNNKGFSLVELIVVIAIMAILAAVAVVSFSVYIERANDAADFEYLSHLTYFAELYAIENQLGLDSVVVSEHGVKGPEDIGLWIIHPTKGRVLYSYPDYESIKEIYDAVGDWEFKGEGFKDEIEYKPEFGGNDNDDANDGDENCLHLDCDITSQPATCKHTGWEKKTCKSCGGEIVNVLPATGIHIFSDTPAYQKGKYSYYICETEGCSQIRIMSSDGSVIVPIN